VLALGVRAYSVSVLLRRHGDRLRDAVFGFAETLASVKDRDVSGVCACLRGEKREKHVLAPAELGEHLHRGLVHDGVLHRYNNDKNKNNNNKTRAATKRSIRYLATAPTQQEEQQREERDRQEGPS